MMNDVTEPFYQQCLTADCAATYAIDEVLFSCRRCGSLLDVQYDWSRCQPPKSLSFFSGRLTAGPLDASGVWRFRELLPFAEPGDVVTVGEGRTMLQRADELATHVGLKPGRLFLQYEGFNPSGSFKDNGMAAAFTMAKRLGKRRVACASTGNTSASLALYAGLATTPQGAPIEAIVFVGGGKIAYGKLAQALDYGAKTLQVRGDFDDCMRLVQQCADRLGFYVMNSVNPFRLEGQKTIMYRVLEGLNWTVPDWLILPGGNLGNASAFGKAFIELRELGLVDRLPRLAVINATGANALYEIYHGLALRFNNGRPDVDAIGQYFHRKSADGWRAATVASAIEIGRPVNLSKALRSLEAMDGVVRQVSDEQILDGKALVGRFGFGCEPASGASIAGLRVLLDEGIVGPSDLTVCILTGHALKDPTATVEYHAGRVSEPRPSGRADVPDAEAPRGLEARGSLLFANSPTPVPADVEAVAAVLDRW